MQRTRDTILALAVFFTFATALAIVAFCAGCSKLPPGSYLEGRAGFNKDAGASGKAILHIPLADDCDCDPATITVLDSDGRSRVLRWMPDGMHEVTTL